MEVSKSLMANEVSITSKGPSHIVVHDIVHSSEMIDQNVGYVDVLEKSLG